MSDDSLNFAQPASINRPSSRIPASSFIPPPLDNGFEPQGNEQQFAKSNAGHDPRRPGAAGPEICGAGGARIEPIEGKMPDFCSSCDYRLK
ncbi:MAG: hypothetical protein Q6373_009660 [Candidatus Sigynarchaeota archaeon]